VTALVLCLYAQVYAVALYVEGEPAAKELGIRDRGGFFETDDDFCSALTDGAFNKTLVVGARLCRIVQHANSVGRAVVSISLKARVVAPTAEDLPRSKVHS
jgi:hypothetical protein